MIKKLKKLFIAPLVFMIIHVHEFVKHTSINMHLLGVTWAVPLHESYFLQREQ